MCISRRRGSACRCLLPVGRFPRGSRSSHSVCFRSVADLEPEFAALIPNVTVKIGGEVTLQCVIDNLGSFKVAWIKVETKNVLTIHRRVVSNNYRISLTHRDNRYWTLKISDIQEVDKGGYMCQVNTVPMRGLIGFINVLVPPTITQPGSNSEVLIREGSNVTLTCYIRGNPYPSVTWQKEADQPIPGGINEDGPSLTIIKVSRLHMGVYICSAFNGVPPAASRRIKLQVHFPPMIWIPNQLIGAPTGGSASLECHTEAYPISINYWTKEDSGMIVSSDKYAMSLQDSSYKVHMKLSVLHIVAEDFGLYKCYARNSLGSTEGSIRLYQSEDPDRFGKIPSAVKEESREDKNLQHTFLKEGQDRRKVFRSPPHLRLRPGGARGACSLLSLSRLLLLNSLTALLILGT